MNRLLALRVHTDQRLGLGHVARALVIAEAWKALGGQACLAVSGDDLARRVAQGLHPLREEKLAWEVVDLGPDLHAPLPPDLKDRTTVVLVDHWDNDPTELEALRPLKVALMEDDSDAHEGADLLFQPFLEGVHFPEHPVKTVQGRKVRPFETRHGDCRVLRGLKFVVVDPAALALRPRRDPLQPLTVRKLLVSFGGTDGPGLAQRAYRVLQDLSTSGRWPGQCTLLDPNGTLSKPFPACRIVDRLPGFTRRMPEFDAIWCAAGLTFVEAMCMGIPAAAWGQNERQHRMIADVALHNGCFDLGVGPEADLRIVTEAVAQWLGPEGQDNRQEHSRDGMSLVDGLGAQRVARELWELAGPA
jgi:spore coat polysaccharide biosynthesis predicted glycosyltransferase SpsG